MDATYPPPGECNSPHFFSGALPLSFSLERGGSAKASRGVTTRPAASTSIGSLKPVFPVGEVKMRLEDDDAREVVFELRG